MSAGQSNPPAAACPPTVEELRRQTHQRLDEIIAFCSRRPRTRVLPRLRDGPAGAPAVAGMLADPTLPPGTPRPARPDGLDAGPRLSRGGPRRRADPQDQLRAGRLCPGLPRAAPRRRARRASPGRRVGPDPRRLQPAGHRLVLPAGHPGELPARQRARGDVPGGGAAGLGDRGVGPGPGPARLRLPQRRPVARGRRRGAGHRDRRQGGPHGHRAGTGAAARPAGPPRAGLQVSAASGPGAAAAPGPEEAAEEGGQEQERPQRHAGGDVHLAAGRGRSAARPDQQEGVRDVRLAEVGAGVGAGAGDAPRLPPRDRQDGADRRRRRDVPGAAAAAAVPRGDPDAGHPARAGEALGGGPAVPPRRQRRS